MRERSGQDGTGSSLSVNAYKKVKKTSKNRLTKETDCDNIDKPIVKPAPNLENDTETETQKETADSESSLAPVERPEKIKKQDETEEFDPGSGRTLAACLTHASRAKTKEQLAATMF